MIDLSSGNGWFFIFCVLCILVFTARQAEAQNIFSEWDEDQDDRLSGEEFESNFSESDYYAFDDWDTNQDAALDENEFTRGIYNSWDTNMDDVLDEDEWDGDNFLEMDDEQRFDAFDQNQDAVIDEDEYSIGMFDAYDMNDDDYLDEDEIGDSSALDNF